MNKILNAVVVIGLVLSVGCQSEKVQKVMRAKAAPLSDFLPNHELLVKQSASFPFHYFYLKQGIPAYENIVIEPVNVDHLRESSNWAQLDQSLNGKLGDNVNDLADFMRKAYVQAFEKSEAKSSLKVVDNRNQPKTLVLESALVAWVPTKAELNAIGFVGGFFIIGAGAVASVLSEGSVTVECRIRDAQTGEIVAMYGDTEKDPRAIVAPSRFTWMASARINIKEIAEQTARVLAAKDYHTIRRDFPVKFLSRIKDGNLDEEEKK